MTLPKSTLSLEEQSRLNLIQFYRDELELIARGEVKPREVFSRRERNHLRKSGVLLKLRGKSGGFYQLSSTSLEALGFNNTDTTNFEKTMGDIETRPRHGLRFREWVSYYIWELENRGYISPSVVPYFIREGVLDRKGNLTIEASLLIAALEE